MTSAPPAAPSASGSRPDEGGLAAAPGQAVDRMPIGSPPTAPDPDQSDTGKAGDSGNIDSARLFFALWPDSATRARLQDLITNLRKAGFAGRWVRPDRLHLTLVFLGEIPRERGMAIEEIAAPSAAERFRISFDEAQLWPRNGILCLAPRNPPITLAELVATLTSRLRAAGFSIETRAFRPHLTIARRALGPDRRILLQTPVRFDVDRYCLIESRLDSAGARYAVRRSWPLAPRTRSAPLANGNDPSRRECSAPSGRS